jgi:ubiquinone/menaquinone biosynthesis C-methylase UbiE
MASALNQFNSISAVYDRMANVVFGSTLNEAQCHFISAIPDRSKILILGGGTGKLLKELLKQRPQSKVTYIEASSKMIAIAKETTNNDSRVVFIHGTQDSIPPALIVDVVITPFFLDLFSDQSLKKIMLQLKSSLHAGGIWIATDFTTSSKLSHRMLRWLMYRFFRFTTNIESTHLPAWQDHLARIGEEVDAKAFKNGFVKTALYRINE